MAITKALIIGGGITGSAAALLLARQGISCAVYELRPTPATIGGAINLSPNALRLFDHIGVYHRLAELACSVSALEMYSVSSGWPLGTLPMGTPERHGYSSIRVLRSDMQTILLEAAEKAGIPIYYDKKLVAIEETLVNVAAVFNDGTKASGDVLLGCDGVHSSVRKQFVDPKRNLIYTGICCAYGLIPASMITAPLNFSRSSFNNSQAGSFLASFYDKELTKIYWTMVMEVQTEQSHDGWKALGKDADTAREKILRRLRLACKIDCLPEMVEKTEDIFLYPVWKLENGGKWFTERCILLGDAAHAMPPHGGGLGIALALEDAALFSRVVEHFTNTSNDGISAIFEKYDGLRRKRVDEIYVEASKNWENIRDVGWLQNMVKEVFFGLYLKWFAKGVEKQWAYDVMKEEL
ncbi:hypothetical protein RUND412_003473 [Rhizina undulata]